MFGRFRWQAACAPVLGYLLACSGGSSEQADAQALLEQLRSLEVNASLSTRKVRIERLEALPLPAGDLDQLRDTCVRAHAELLASEVAQAEVKQALSDAKAAAAADRPERAEAHRTRVRALLSQSEAALAEARSAFPACRDQMHELATRAR